MGVDSVPQTEEAPTLPVSKKKVVPNIETLGKQGLLPVHAWTIVAHESDQDRSAERLEKLKRYNNHGTYDYEDGDGSGFVNCTVEEYNRNELINLGKFKDGPSTPISKRLRFFYISFLLYGIDVSDTVTGFWKWVLYAIKLTFLIVYSFISFVHWMEVVCSLKDDYIEYGSCLVNLVFCARITSGIISHTMIHNRRKRIAKLALDLDEIGDTVPYSYEHKRNMILNLIFGLSAALMYCAFPVKYLRDRVTASKLIDTDDNFYYQTHLFAMTVLDNVPMNILTFVLMYFDVMTLSFFIAFGARFYTVFRAAPFVRWFSNGEIHELSMVMRKFRRHHYVICNVVEDVDGAFAPVVLIWYVYLTMALCCWIRGFSTSAFETYDGAITVTFCMATAIIEFFFLSVSTALINDEVTSHLESIRMICINEEYKFTVSMTAMQDRIAHLSYVTCVLASPISLTGWGFFPVSRGFVLTVTSTVMTFTLVLYGV